MQALDGRVCELDVQGVVACITGLASLRMRPQDLMLELDRACAEAVHTNKCKVREVAQLMSAFAQLGFAALALCAAAVEQDGALASQRNVDVQSRIALVWAMWFLAARPGTVLCAQQERALYDLAPSHGVSDTALVQLFQVCSLCCVCGCVLRLCGAWHS